MKTTQDVTTAGLRPAADLILPAQFHHRPPARPEESLMLAILEDALACIRRGADATDTRSRRIFREAQQWMHCGDREWPFSFENICYTLDIDVGYVRGKVRRWQLRPLPEPTRPRATVRLRPRHGGTSAPRSQA